MQRQSPCLSFPFTKIFSFSATPSNILRLCGNIALLWVNWLKKMHHLQSLKFSTSFHFSPVDILNLTRWTSRINVLSRPCYTVHSTCSVRFLSRYFFHLFLYACYTKLCSLSNSEKISVDTSIAWLLGFTSNLFVLSSPALIEAISFIRSKISCVSLF